MAASRDPRNEGNVHAFSRKRLLPEEYPPEPMALIALLLGVVGLIMKNKMCAWCAFFATLSSMCTVSYNNIDYKQIVCSVVFSGMGVVMNYSRKTPEGGSGAWR
jgi:hypothetical protein